MEVENINMPKEMKNNIKISHNNAWGETTRKVNKKRKITYIYAAYLPPGLHSFLIYDPRYKRIYCKDVLIDLSNSYYYPEYPKPFGTKEEVRKKTKQNVWRKWREDSQMDIELALVEDLHIKHFEPKLFMKNEVDAQRCT